MEILHFLPSRRQATSLMSVTGKCHSVPSGNHRYVHTTLGRSQRTQNINHAHRQSEMTLIIRSTATSCYLNVLKEKQADVIISQIWYFIFWYLYLYMPDFHCNCMHFTLWTQKQNSEHPSRAFTRYQRGLRWRTAKRAWAGKAMASPTRAFKSSVLWMSIRISSGSPLKIAWTSGGCKHRRIWIRTTRTHIWWYSDADSSKIGSQKVDSTIINWQTKMNTAQTHPH